MEFQETVYAHARRLFRPLPWRETTDPYRILVSEVMLQQTQVPRVLAKYQEFLARFPTVEALADAPVSSVVEAWLGLGYNRRALALHRAAQVIVRSHGGLVPRDVATLRTLPGIGHATACAIAAFAFNQPVVFLETNIRSVFLHHFFPDTQGIGDGALMSLVDATLDAGNPREWFWALMDYGNHLKATGPNPARRSARHRRQTPFEGSHRQLRGRILRQLASSGPEDLDRLAPVLRAEVERVVEAVRQLRDEGFVSLVGRKVSLRRDAEPT